MSTFWLKAFELILSLSLLVFIHEFGHYMWARIFGVKVEKFYLFFNPWVTLMAWLPKTKKVSCFAPAKAQFMSRRALRLKKSPPARKPLGATPSMVWAGCHWAVIAPSLV